MDSASDCRLYDERGALRGQVAIQGEVPLLAAGNNTVEFACEGSKGHSARAMVTVIACGEPLCATTANDAAR
jgi:hypothetical protein